MSRRAAELCIYVDDGHLVETVCDRMTTTAVRSTAVLPIIRPTEEAGFRVHPTLSTYRRDHSTIHTNAGGRGGTRA